MTPMVDYDDPDLLPEDQRFLLEAVGHLSGAEEHLEEMLGGVQRALQAFHQADEIVPLDGQALAEARRAQRTERILHEAGRLFGEARVSVAPLAEDPDIDGV